VFFGVSKTECPFRMVLWNTETCQGNKRLQCCILMSVYKLVVDTHQSTFCCAVTPSLCNITATISMYSLPSIFTFPLQFVSNIIFRQTCGTVLSLTKLIGMLIINWCLPVDYSCICCRMSYHCFLEDVSLQAKLNVWLHHDNRRLYFGWQITE
jgi:hypothetical protein